METERIEWLVEVVGEDLESLVEQANSILDRNELFVEADGFEGYVLGLAEAIASGYIQEDECLQLEQIRKRIVEKKPFWQRAKKYFGQVRSAMKAGYEMGKSQAPEKKPKPEPPKKPERKQVLPMSKRLERGAMTPPVVHQLLKTQGEKRARAAKARADAAKSKAKAKVKAATSSPSTAPILKKKDVKLSGADVRSPFKKKVLKDPKEKTTAALPKKPAALPKKPAVTHPGVPPKKKVLKKSPTAPVAYERDGV